MLAIAKEILYISLRFGRVSCGKLSFFCGKRTVFVEKALKRDQSQSPRLEKITIGGRSPKILKPLE
ncbi:hypothetical protein [Picosynechococcus sp. PCC 73109]